MNIKIHISKQSITFRDDNDNFLEEFENNLSSPRILIQDVEKAKKFFTEKIKKYSGKIIRPKVTLSLDENIFDDGITKAEEFIIFEILHKSIARKLFYKGKEIEYEP